MQARVSQTLDLVNVVIGRQFARAAIGKIGHGLAFGDFVFGQNFRLTVGVKGEGRMWLEADSRL